MGDERSRLLSYGLIGPALIALALVLLAVGSQQVAEDRGANLGSAFLVAVGFGLVVAGVTLLMAAFRLRGTDQDEVPWLSLAGASLAVGAFIAMTTLALADAFVERKPSRVVACPENTPGLVQTPGPDQIPAVFTFPDEAEQTAGLKVQMGRSRPGSARSDQILVFESGDPPVTGDDVGADQQEPAEETPNGGSDADAASDPVSSEYLQVALSELRRDDGARLNRQLVSGWARMLNNRNMEVAICFEPLSEEFAETDPGRYTGRLTVIDPRVARMEIPVEIQMQFDRWPILVVLLIGTLVVAAFTLYNGVKQLSGETASLDTPTLREFRNWVTTNPVAIGTGVVAAVALFASQYLADPAWSGRTYEVFALIGATAASFLGAATIAAGLDPSRKRSKTDGDEADKQVGVGAATTQPHTGTSVGAGVRRSNQSDPDAPEGR